MKGIVSLLVLLLAGTLPATADAGWWQGPVSATWYGPGFYYNTFACADGPGGLPDRYRPNTRGVAVNSRFARCGAKFTIRRWGRVIKVQVIDRCPGCNTTSHPFDLTARSAMDLCLCTRPYTQRVRYHKRW